MAVIETWFNQDLQKPVKTQYIDGSLFGNNANGNRIGVVVTDNGEPVTISGTVSGYVVVSDGSTVPCTGAKSGNRASILIPPAAYVPGSAFISLFITDGTTVTTIAAVSTTVLQTRTGTQVDPGSVVTDWTQTINNAMQDVQTAAANLGSIVATPYASLTYPVPLGKYTYYDGGLYRCISPIASSETFTPAHWTAVKLGDDVSDLKSAFNSLIETEDNTNTWANGAFIVADGSTNNSQSRLRMNDFVSLSDNIIGFKAKTGYEFMVFAWDKSSGTYIGALKTSNTFLKDDSANKWITEFLLAYNPAYKFRVTLRNANSTSSTLTINDASNCLYIVEKTDKSLSIDKVPADAKETGIAVGSNSVLRILDDVSYFIDETDARWTIADYTYVNSTNGALVDASGESKHYKTYYATFEKAHSFYVENYGTGGYCSIAIYNGVLNTSNFVAIYRASNNNLPTKESPLSVGTGVTIAVSIRDNFDFMLVGTNIAWDLLSAKLKRSVISDSANKGMMYKYNSQTGSNYTGTVNIVVPTDVGYIRYDFLHNEDDTINCDIWRVNKAVALADDKTERYDLTTQGEWEVALELDGRSDFSGGVAHGDEKYNNIVFLIDGLPITLQNMETEYTDVSEIRIFEKSTLYDPNDHTTVIAYHTSEHIFNADGLTINQTVKWAVSAKLKNSFMAMLPISKSVSNYIATDNDYDPRSLSSLPVNYGYPVNKSEVYGSSNGMICSFDIPKYPVLSSIPSNRLRVIDNGNPSYNKCYYYVTATADEYQTSVNELWQSETKYNFVIGK